ncbi:hypothetical protein Droror1_Dr00027025 [Drosera rotundifolia]
MTAHERLITMVHRSRLGFSSSSTCTLCGLKEKTTVHLLRDCIHAERVWDGLVQQHLQPQFFNLNLHAWLDSNLRNTKRLHNQVEWRSLFMLICWWLWKWGNQKIFRPSDKVQDNKLAFMLAYAEQAHAALTTSTTHSTQQSPVQVRWKPPCEGWIALNTDGASKRECNKATAGSVIRDCRGRWILGFTAFLGYCSALVAELQAIILGLEQAWNRGYRRVVLQSDSLFY